MGFLPPPWIAQAWEERWDKQHKRPFFYNTITKQSVWDHPKVTLKKQPPPPPPPKPFVREQDLWCKVDDGKGKGKMVWYHRVTEERQYNVPECRVKYKPYRR